MIGILAHYDFWIDLTASVLGLLLYVGSTHTLQQRRHPAAAVSWILMFVFLPWVALPAYILFGQRKIKADFATLSPPWPLHSAARNAQDDDDSRGWMSTMLISLGGAPVRDTDTVRLHRDGREAETELWAVIDAASERLCVSTYVLGNDRIGNELIARLAARARDGVDVRLLLDGVGCFFVRHQQLAPLTTAGGRVARAFPPLRRMLQRQSNFRNHRKMVVADERLCWMGGRNFADEYFSGKTPQTAWPDLSLTIRGEAGGDAQAIFVVDWFWACGERLELHRPSAPRALRALSRDLKRPADASSMTAALQVPRDYQQIQLLASGPDQPQDALQAFMVTGCYRAQTRILAASPYLIPDPALLQALCLAARRGVMVDIVLPARSNHVLADLARNRAMRELAQAGVRLWLSPKMMHAKALVFDDLAMTGSANLDIRSLFLNFELALVLYDAADAEQLANWIEHHRQVSAPYVADQPSLPRDLLEGAVLWVGFQL